MIVETTTYYPAEKAALVAGFNTNGDIKSKISTTLTPTSTFPLDGLYVRTEFVGYAFFPHFTSRGDDISQLKNLADDIPGLIAATSTQNAAAGFDTDGWMKSSVSIPPNTQPPGFADSDRRGIYLRTAWPDFAFLCGYDSPGNNIGTPIKGTVEQMILAARANASIVAFTTDGNMKSALASDPTLLPKPDKLSLSGVYVKTVPVPDLKNITSSIPSLPPSRPGGTGLTSPVPASNSTIPTADSTALEPQRKNSTLPAPGNASSTAPVPTSADSTVPEPQGTNVTPPALGSTNSTTPAAVSVDSTVPEPQHTNVTSPVQGGTSLTPPVAISTSATAPNHINFPPVSGGTSATASVPISTDATVPAPKHITLTPPVPESVTLTPSHPDTTLSEHTTILSRPVSELPELLALTDPPFGEGEFNVYLFAFKVTAFIWGAYFIKDSANRLRYNSAVSAQSADVFQRTQAAALANPTNARAIWMQGASQAHGMRNLLLQETRDRTTPLGRALAQSIKPNGKPYLYYLNLNANKKFHTNFENLDDTQAATIAADTIRSAGRANPNITYIMRGLRISGQALVIAGCVISVYSVVIADDWRIELAQQAGSWYAAISLGQAGSGVGAVFGPLGAILGGLAGGLAGAYGVPALANWFFGGSSSLSALELLGDMHDEVHAAVNREMKMSGASFHVHRVHATHLSVASAIASSDKAARQSHAVAMVSTTSEDNLAGAKTNDVRLCFAKP